MDASWIYTTNTSGGSYPFNAFGHLVLQARSSSARDIVFMSCIGAATTPTVAMIIEETAASRVWINRAVTTTSTLEVQSRSGFGLAGTSSDTLVSIGGGGAGTMLTGTTQLALLADLVLDVYDIAEDDRQFKQLVDGGEQFRYIRKHYPIRREFSAIKVNTGNFVHSKAIYDLGFLC